MEANKKGILAITTTTAIIGVAATQQTHIAASAAQHNGNKNVLDLTEHVKFNLRQCHRLRSWLRAKMLTSKNTKSSKITAQAFAKTKTKRARNQTTKHTQRVLKYNGRQWTEEENGHSVNDAKANNRIVSSAWATTTNCRGLKNEYFGGGSKWPFACSSDLSNIPNLLFSSSGSSNQSVRDYQISITHALR